MKIIYTGKGIYQKGKREKVMINDLVVKKCKRCGREVEIAGGIIPWGVKNG